MVRWQLAVVNAVVLVFAAQAAAKRIPPNPVSPVVFDGVRYTAEGDGRDAYVVAADASDNKVLWRVKVFHNRIKYWMEIDAQFVYITDLRLSNNSLLVSDERARCYSVNLVERRVRKHSCGSVSVP